MKNKTKQMITRTYHQNQKKKKKRKNQKIKGQAY